MHREFVDVNFDLAFLLVELECFGDIKGNDTAHFLLQQLDLCVQFDILLDELQAVLLGVALG